MCIPSITYYVREFSGLLKPAVTQWPMVPQLRTPDMQEVEVKGKYPEALKTVQLW